MPIMSAMSAHAGFLRDRASAGTTKPAHLVQIDMILIDADDGRWQAVGTPTELTTALLNLLPRPLDADNLARLAALAVGCEVGDVILIEAPGPPDH